jgi:hypothetical protein
VSGTTLRILEMLDRRGRALSLRRRVGTTSAFTDCAPRGYSRGFRTEELVGGIAQGDREVVIANAEIDAASWPGPPRKGDLVVADGATLTVQGVLTMYDGPDRAAHILWVRG